LSDGLLLRGVPDKGVDQNFGAGIDGEGEGAIRAGKGAILEAALWLDRNALEGRAVFGVGDPSRYRPFLGEKVSAYAQ